MIAVAQTFLQMKSYVHLVNSCVYMSYLYGRTRRLARPSDPRGLGRRSQGA